MKKKKFLASFLVAAIMLTVSMDPVFAADTQNVSSESNASVAVSGSVTPKSSSVISVTVPTQMSFVLDFTKDNPLITSPAAIANDSTKAVNIVLKSIKANSGTNAKVVAHDKYTDSEWNALGTDDSESQIALGLNDGSSDYWFNAEADDSSDKASFTVDSGKNKNVSIIAKYGKAWKNAAELNYSMVLGVSLCNSSSGSSATDQSLFTTKDNGDGTCTVTGFNKTANIPDVVVPSTINGKKVVSIGEYAFEGCKSLISVNIPDSVTSIGEFAFDSCTSLASVNIPNSVTSIGWGAFYECNSLTSVNIPNLVTSIGSNAFEECTSLTSVNISHSVTSIKDSTFRNCTSLKSVNIPNAVTSIEDKAFQGCTLLASVNIPNSVTSIGLGAFEGCTSLTSANIPHSVTLVKDSAFGNCTSLKSINIPNSITAIGNYAFCGCTSLTSANIPNSVSFIGKSAFYECNSLTSTNIPNSVSSIGESAFFNWTSSQTIYIHGTNYKKWDSNWNSGCKAKIVYEN